LKDFPDARDQEMITYPRETLIWSALLMLLLGMRSRRQFRFESGTDAFVRNLNALADTEVESAPHDDTIIYYFKGVPINEFERLPQRIVRQLIRMKALDRYRLHGRFLIALDGTGQYFYRKKHCDNCLTQTRPDGTTLYFHNMLEAKLVTQDGLVFSIASQPIENIAPEADKQDCELNAFYRMATGLKKVFPQLPITLLGDAIYANATVMGICELHKWKYICTFKKGRTPSLFQEYETLRDVAKGNRSEQNDNGREQRFAWVNGLNHEGHNVNAFECREDCSGESHYFAWISNIEVGCRSVMSLANKGGRCRWKIENQGFKIQKRHGYELEHAYCQNEKVAKMFYFLIQVAHAINQLMINGSLIKDFSTCFGSLRNYLRRLAEAFRNSILNPLIWNDEAWTPFQIRIRPPP
jgi:hypothetical protein